MPYKQGRCPEVRCREVEDLCGSILATLTLESNQRDLRSGLGVEPLLRVVSDWSARFNALRRAGDGDDV